MRVCRVLLMIPFPFFFFFYKYITRQRFEIISIKTAYWKMSVYEACTLLKRLMFLLLHLVWKPDQAWSSGWFVMKSLLQELCITSYIKYFSLWQVWLSLTFFMHVILPANRILKGPWSMACLDVQTLTLHTHLTFIICSSSPFTSLKCKSAIGSMNTAQTTFKPLGLCSISIYFLNALFNLVRILCMNVLKRTTIVGLFDKANTPHILLSITMTESVIMYIAYVPKYNVCY